MPLINIYLNEGKTSEYKTAVSDALHEALLETWSIPEDDRFQIFHETKREDLQIDDKMWMDDEWDGPRSDEKILFHIFTSPRTSEMKLALYHRLPQILEQKTGLRPEDVFVSLASNAREDWSFGRGRAQLLEVQPPPTAAAAGGRSLGMAAQTSLKSLVAAPRLGGAGGGVVGRLGLAAACGASAFLGTLAARPAAKSAIDGDSSLM